MKALFELLATICFFLSAIFFSACKNSYDSMISDFNEKYFLPEPPRLPDYSINGADFVASEMLEPDYIFPIGYYVNVEAPEGADSYSWKCINADGTETEISTKRLLNYQIPGVFKVGETNSLLLTVTTKNGSGKVIEYKDKAIVILRDTSLDSSISSNKMCLLSISIDNDSSARTINPLSLTDKPELLTHFVLKGVSPSTGAELNDGAGIDLSSYLSETSHSTAYEIPYGVWNLTLEAGDGTHVWLRGKKFADLRTPEDKINFVLKTNNYDGNGSVSLSGTYIDNGHVANVCEAEFYSLNNNALKYPVTVTVSDVEAPVYAFEINGLTDVMPDRYSFIMKFYDSDDEENRKLVGYWEDIVVVAPGRKTEKTDIECKSIISQLPQKPGKLTAYSVDNTVVDRGEEGKFFTARFKWEDSSINEESFILTLYKCQDKNKTENAELYREYTIENTFDDASFVAGSLGAGSTQCDIQLPCETAFIAKIQAVNFVGRSEACDYEKDAGNNSDGTKGFGGSTIWYNP